MHGEELQRCIGDLLTLSSLAALQTYSDPRRLAEDLASALVPMLDVSFVCAKFAAAEDANARSVLCTSSHTSPKERSDIINGVKYLLPSPRAEESISSGAFAGAMHVAVAPLDERSGSQLIAGSRSADFLTDVKRVLLRVAAKELAVAVLHSRAEHAGAKLRDLKMAFELQLSASTAELLEATAELAEANERLIQERKDHAGAESRMNVLRDEFLRCARFSAAGEMTTALAHELTQPLGAAMNTVHAARITLEKRKADSSGAVGPFLDEAARQIRRVGEIVQRWRDLAKSGEIEKRPECVQTLIEEATALALPATNGSSAKVTLKLDPAATHVLVDRIQIQEVLINLMRNASEAMELQDRRELTIATRAHGAAIEIAVSDTGPGITPETAKRLFEPFFTTKRNGMGLGLSICRTILQAHGGQLEMDPNGAGGTTFRFLVATAPPETLHVV
ncbi:MAG: ATP-binding protein [Rhodomicrobium sp.]